VDSGQISSVAMLIHVTAADAVIDIGWATASAAVARTSSSTLAYRSIPLLLTGYLFSGVIRQ
jgi:hypothetical protein